MNDFKPVPKPEKKASKGKKKRKGKTQLQKTDDAVFGYMRLKAHLDGVKRCVTCNHDVEYGTFNYQAGHFISREVHKFRYDPKNVHIQCYACNIAKKRSYTKLFSLYKRNLWKRTVRIF